jgi:hypothetical protein
MPILNPSHTTSAELLGLSGSALRFLSAAAGAVNAMTQKLLVLDNAALESWLNSQSIADMTALFTAHATAGTAINTASQTTSDQLVESGVPGGYTEADVRPFQDKLAAQGRQANYNGIQWVVSSLS